MHCNEPMNQSETWIVVNQSETRIVVNQPHNAEEAMTRGKAAAALLVPGWMIELEVSHYHLPSCISLDTVISHSATALHRGSCIYHRLYTSLYFRQITQKRQMPFMNVFVMFCQTVFTRLEQNFQTLELILFFAGVFTYFWRISTY